MSFITPKRISIKSILFELLFVICLFHIIYLTILSVNKYFFISIDFSLLSIFILVYIFIESIFVWCQEVVYKSFSGKYTKKLRSALFSGLILFLASEVLLFVSIFWCFFDRLFHLSYVTDFLSVPTTVEILIWYKEFLYAMIVLLASCNNAYYYFQLKDAESRIRILFLFYLFLNLLLINFFFRNQFWFLYSYYCINFSSVLLLLIVNSLFLYLIYKDKDKVNLGLLFPTLRLYFYIYLLFYLNLYILISFTFLNSFFYIVNLNYYFNFLYDSLMDYLSFSYLEWIDSELEFKLNSTNSNYLEMNNNNSNNKLSIESSKGSLASKLSGVDKQKIIIYLQMKKQLFVLWMLYKKCQFDLKKVTFIVQVQDLKTLVQVFLLMGFEFRKQV